MSDFEKCPCGERAGKYCRGCRTRKCRFCMISDIICMPCRETKRARKLAELTGKVGKQIKALRALHGHWNDFADDVMHDEKRAGIAQKAMDRLHASIHHLEELQGAIHGRESVTTDELDREKEERATRGTPYAT